METKSKDDRENVVYYYNREARMARAGADAHFAVDHYKKGGSKRRSGFWKSLLGTRANRFLFAAVVGMAAIGLAYQGFSRQPASARVAGSVVTAKAIWFDDAVYVDVDRKAAKKGSVPVSLEVTVGDGRASVRGLMSASEDELKLRLPSEARPGSVTIGVASGDEADGFAATVE